MEKNPSGSILPGQIPAPPTPIVFPSQHAGEADSEERYRQYSDFLEYATPEELAAYQRAMIKQGLMDEPPKDEDEESQAAEEYPQAVSKAQVYWARRELQIGRNGGYTKIPISALMALANTALAGLPERSGQRKPTKQVKKPGKTKRTVNKR